MEPLNLSRPALIWVIAVIGASALLWTLVHYGLGLVIRRLDARGRKTVVLPTIRRILQVLVWVLGMGMVSYAFLDKQQFALMNQHLLRVSWIAFVLMATIVVSAMSRAFFDRRIRTTSARDRQDTTTYRYLKSLATLSIYGMGLILAALAIPAARTLATTALTGAGVLALIIGVAAQEAFANVVGGLFIAFFKPFRLGDVVKVAGTVGRVEDLTLRHTVINNFQNKRIVIPNAIINKETIENYNLTEYETCEFVEVGISYDSDLDRAIEIMREEAGSHPYAIDNRSHREQQEGKPIVDVQVIGLGESSVNLRAWVWAATYVTGFRMRNDLLKSIKLRFDREGIEIPFPHRTIVVKSHRVQEQTSGRAATFPSHA